MKKAILSKIQDYSKWDFDKLIQREICAVINRKYRTGFLKSPLKILTKVSAVKSGLAIRIPRISGHESPAVKEYIRK